MNSSKPLRVLNTRPAESAQTLNKALHDAGFIPVTMPGLTITPVSDDWLSAIVPLTQAQQAIFISPNAVTYCFDYLNKHHIVWPKTIRVTAIGTATATRLAIYGIPVCQVPSIATSEHLIELDSFQSIQHQTIFLFKGCDGRELIAQSLLEKGAKLIPVRVYCTHKAIIPTEQIDFLWQNNAIDTIVFTSAQALQNIVSAFTQDSLSWLCHKPCIVISERLAHEAVALGMKHILITRYDDIINTLIQMKQGLLHDSGTPYCNE